MNEAGAKNVGMLALDGEPHVAARTRVSLMTTVVSTQLVVNDNRHGLPIKILFRGATDRILKELESPESANVCLDLSGMLTPCVCPPRQRSRPMCDFCMLESGGLEVRM